MCVYECVFNLICRKRPHLVMLNLTLYIGDFQWSVEYVFDGHERSSLRLQILKALSHK